jgi:hypothetical protein
MLIERERITGMSSVPSMTWQLSRILQGRQRIGVTKLVTLIVEQHQRVACPNENAPCRSLSQAAAGNGIFVVGFPHTRAMLLSFGIGVVVVLA